MADTSLVINVSTGTVEEVPLTDEEIVDREEHAAAEASAAAGRAFNGDEDAERLRLVEERAAADPAFAALAELALRAPGV